MRKKNSFCSKNCVSFLLTKDSIFRRAAFNVHQYVALDLTNYLLAFGNVFVGKVRDLNQFFWQVSTVNEIHSRFSCLHCRHRNRRILQYSVFSVQWTDIPIIYYNLKHEQLRAHSHSSFRSIVARTLHTSHMFEEWKRIFHVTLFCAAIEQTIVCVCSQHSFSIWFCSVSSFIFAGIFRARCVCWFFHSSFQFHSVFHVWNANIWSVLLGMLVSK